MILKNGQSETRVWVQGFPKSQQGSSFDRYRKKIRRAAQEKFSAPLDGQVEVEVVFADKRERRPDVDNVVKPIVDALKGVAYHDDSQVVSATANLIPVRDDLRVDGGKPHNTFVRLFDQDEFLIRIRERPRWAMLEGVESS